MKKTCAILGLLLQAFWLLAHPLPNTIIALSVAPKRLVFDLKIPLSDVETAVFQTQQGNISLSVLEQYFSKHMNIKGMDGAIWPCQFISSDTVQAKNSHVGKYAELHLVIHATPPLGADIRQFVLNYDAILHQIVTHQALLSIQQDWDNGIYTEEGGKNTHVLSIIQVEQSTGEILPVAVKIEQGSTWKGFVAIFHLGMKHIAEGYDHLLFLIVLLLPAPLLLEKRRWGGFGGWRYSFLRLAKIVTAFTVGHSLTLAAAAMGWFSLPTQPVEVVIALSILVSAIHAFRPIFPEREAWVASGFGLVHGLAFASILSNLNLDSSRLALSLLGFNMGIEAMQLAVVVAVLPILVLLSKTKAYPLFRIIGAILSAFLAIIWAWERFFEVEILSVFL